MHAPLQAPEVAQQRGVASDLVRVRRDGAPPLMVPAAVRLFDLELPLTDLRLPRPRRGGAYRSLFAVPRLGGDPLGAVTVPVGPKGRVPRSRLAYWFRRSLEAELREAFVKHGLTLPLTLPRAGVGTDRRGRTTQPVGCSVSVIVTTCAGPVGLEPCLRSILASDWDEFEVIVVENRPGSGTTASMLAERFANEPRLRYMEEARAGLSRARNRGLGAAEGALVAFTDDDVIVEPTWVRRCAEAFERADDVACVTGLILPFELETEPQLLLEQYASLGKGFRRRTWRLSEAQDMGPPLLYTPGAIGSGANTVLRADIAARLGGFDAALGAGTPSAGGEDLDLFIRLLRGGHAVAYEPSAIVWHRHPEGTSRLRRQVRRYGMGLGAMLTKQLVAGPERRKLLRAVPAGVRYARDPASRKNERKHGDYPRGLEWLERLGMLIGPAGYLASALVSATRRLPGRGAPRELSTAASRDGHAGARAGDRALPAAAAAACVVAPLLVALGAPPGLRLPAVLAMLCLAPGTALIASLGGRFELGLAVGASLAGSAVVAQSMLWLGVWSPTAWIYALAAVCGWPLVVRLRRATRGSPARRLLAELTRIGESVGRIPRYARWHAALLSAALLAWAASLLGADLSRIDGLGLLSAMPPTYFLAFALLLAGFVGALSREKVAPKLLGAYVLALILVLHATTPLLYAEPRYQWVYNHLGVIDLIADRGAVDRQIDIYNNWPGFFVLNAWLTSVTGVAPVAYAPWAQVFFNVVGVAALRFALRGVTRDERLLWTATWLFVLGNWVGQDYLAPQAFGFVLSLVVLGLCLRCAPPPSIPRSRAGRRWARGLERLRGIVVRRASVADAPAPAPLSPRGALILGGLCYLAVVVSHQLTPVMLLAGVTALALVTRRVPIWVPVAMAAVEIWWLALAWPYISDHWTLFDPDPGASGAPAGYEVGDGMSGLALVAYAARVETVLMVGLAAIGLVRRARAGHWDIAAASLVVAPLVVVGAQSYGGEGPYRLYLFALPWLSLLAAAACAPSSAARVARGKLGLRQRRALCMAVAGGMSLRSAAAAFSVAPATAHRWWHRWLRATESERRSLACLRDRSNGPGRPQSSAAPGPNLFRRSRLWRPLRNATVPRQWRLALATGAAGACLLFAYFGLELINRVSSQDVAAARWFERNAPRGSLLVQATSNSVSRVTSRYATTHDIRYTNSPALTDRPSYRHRALGSADLPRLEGTLRRYGAAHTFVALTLGQQRFARLYGVLPTGWRYRLEGALDASPSFRPVYRHGPSSIYEYRP